MKESADPHEMEALTQMTDYKIRLMRQNLGELFHKRAATSGDEPATTSAGLSCSASRRT